MAGDWIKMRVALRDDPATIAICEATGLDAFAVVGRLHALWGWADQHTLTGNAKGNATSVTQNWIDRYLDAPGFAKAMIEAGWLRPIKGGLLFPDFAKHNGKTAKTRALTAARVAAHKAKKGNAKGNAPSVTTALAREEKIYKPPLPPHGGGGRDPSPNGQTTPKLPPAWWKDPSKAAQAGALLGVRANAGEDMATYCGRLRAELERRKHH